MNAVAHEKVTVVTTPARQKIETLQKTVSASRLSCWLTCRLKFFFRYVQQLTKPPTPSLHVGSVVHSVLQQWNLDRWRKQPFETEKLKALFDTRWTEQAKIDWRNDELKKAYDKALVDRREAVAREAAKP